MKALVYHGGGKKSWEEKPKPLIIEPTDAVVKILKTTICGTDLHIMKGDVPTVTDGRIIGHEGVGIIEDTGSAVSNFKRGDHVLISCITACGFSTPMLLKNVRFHKLDPNKLITHHFKLAEIVEAYNTFGNAANEKALNVILTNE